MPIAIIRRPSSNLVLAAFAQEVALEKLIPDDSIMATVSVVEQDCV